MGTPISTVASGSQRMISAQSNLGRKIIDPPATSDTLTATNRPWIWKMGNACSSTSSGVKRQVSIGSVMTTDPVTIDLGQPLSEVYHVLQHSSFHHVPVLDGDRPVGMISSTDVLKLVYDVGGRSDKMLTTMLDHQFTLEDAMTTDLVTLPDTATVHDAAEVLAAGSMHSVVVVTPDGALAGIVTSTDLVRFLRDL